MNPRHCTHCLERMLVLQCGMFACFCCDLVSKMPIYIKAKEKN